MWEGFGGAPVDEQLLLRRFVRGDRDAFERIVARYERRVARLAQRLLGWIGDVDDVVQDVFLAVYEQGHKFRGDSDLWPWLTAITVNKCRSRMRRHFLKLRWLNSRPAEGPQSNSADRDSLRDETSTKVRTAVRALPAKDREVIVLYYLEDRPVAEISRMLGSSENAIDVRLHRARKRLKEMLGEFAST
jgi:RNA polymerase sigma-70 factor (ECF subfamily)